MATREQQRGLNAHEVATLLVLAAVWGASFLFIKVAVHDIGPLLLVTTRVALATVAMLAYLVRQIGWGSLRATLRRVRVADALVLSITGSTLPFLLISWAETRISSGLAGILNATTPLFTVVIAIAIGQGLRMGWRMWGLLLGFAGASLVAWGDFAGSPLAIAAMIAAAPLYAVSALHAREHFADVEPACVALVQVLTSSVMLLPVALLFGRPQHSPGLDTIVSLILLSFGGTAFAYVLYYRLIASAGPQHAIAVTYLVPVVAVMYGRVLLSERIRMSALIGMAVIIVGEAICASPGRTGRATPPGPAREPLPP